MRLLLLILASVGLSALAQLALKIGTTAAAGTRTAGIGGEVGGVVEKAWTAERQNRWLVGGAFAGMIAGIILWSVLPGEIARALPASWDVPEKMAARLMRMDMKEAGQRLVAVAHLRAAGAAAKQKTTPPLAEPTSPVPANPALRRP